MILAGFIRRVTTHYTITNRRLHIQRGIISRDIQETRLERVQNVNYNQSPLERLLQVGDVDFDTAAGDDFNFIFFGVANPADVVEQVDRATHAIVTDGPRRPAHRRAIAGPGPAGLVSGARSPSSRRSRPRPPRCPRRRGPRPNEARPPGRCAPR